MSFFTEVLTHTSFFMLFLPFFFFFYVSGVQSKSFTKDLFNSIKPAINSSGILINKDSDINFTQVTTELANVAINSEYAQTETSHILTNNKNTILIASLVFGLSGAFFLAIALFIHYRNGESIKDLLLSNIITLAFIIMSEFVIVGVFLPNFVEMNDEFINGVLGGGICLDYVYDFLQKTLTPTLLNLFYKPQTSS